VPRPDPENWLKREREALHDGRPGPAPPLRDVPPLGLALSGGGIRSASICLGFLQALHRTREAERSALDGIDYLSTVSGGGYVGLGWLARAAREAPGFPYERKEQVGEGETVSPFLHLRNRAAYLLAPGMRSVAEALAMVLRKFLANLLTPLAGILLLAWLSALVQWGVQPDGFCQPATVADGTGRAVAAFPWRAVFLWVAGVLMGLGFLGSCLLAWAETRGEADPSAPARRAERDGRAGAAFALALLALLACLHLWLVGIFLGASCGAGSDWMGSLSMLAGAFGSFAALFPVQMTGLLTARLRGRAGPLLLSLAGLLLLLLNWLAALFGAALLSRWFLAAGSWPAGLPVAVRIVLPALLAGLLALLNSRIGPNATSLHGFYRDRLADAFMGKAAPPPLSALMPKRTGGPFPIVNMTVNGVGLKEERRRGREAMAFTLTPLQTGNSFLGYCETRDLEETEPSFDTASAMAVSGAAISSAMGGGSRLQSLLRGLLNLRTALWLPSPLRARDATQRRPFRARPGLWTYMRELSGFGLIRLQDPQILVSDGGHWENLGLLALLHRNCGRILVVDAEADPEMRFHGLARAVMLARLDLGCEISIDAAALRPGANGLVARPFVFGTACDREGRNVEILYIKAAVCGDESLDVLEYRSRFPDFPQQSTADQFFDESQFEAYRALGAAIGRKVMHDPRVRGWLLP